MCRTESLAAARGTFRAGVWEAAGAQRLEGCILGTAEQPQSCLGADMGVRRGSEPHRALSPALATASPYPSVPRPSPIAPKALWHSSPFPVQPLLARSPVSSPLLPAPVSHHENLGSGLPAALHLPKPSPPWLLPCQGSRCGISDANMVTLQLLEVPQEQWDLLRGRGDPQHPAGTLRSPANLQLIASGENSVIKRRAHRGAKQQEGKQGASREGAQEPLRGPCCRSLTARCR